MKILVFLDSLLTASKYIRLFNNSVSFIATGRPGLSGLSFELLRILRRGEIRVVVRLVKLWFSRRVYLSNGTLKDLDCLNFIHKLQPDVALHGMGVIYNARIINSCGLGILNAHIGKLPRLRGRCVMEWSLFIGEETGVTVFFIDEGIDTGSPIIFFRSVNVLDCDNLASAKKKLFDHAPFVYFEAIGIISRNYLFVENSILNGCRYYEMSNFFKNVLERRFFDRSS